MHIADSSRVRHTHEPSLLATSIGDLHCSCVIKRLLFRSVTANNARRTNVGSELRNPMQRYARLVVRLQIRLPTSADEGGDAPGGVGADNDDGESSSTATGAGAADSPAPPPRKKSRGNLLRTTTLLRATTPPLVSRGKKKRKDLTTEQEERLDEWAAYNKGVMSLGCIITQHRESPRPIIEPASAAVDAHPISSPSGFVVRGANPLAFASTRLAAAANAVGLPLSTGPDADPADSTPADESVSRAMQSVSQQASMAYEVQQVPPNFVPVQPHAHPISAMPPMLPVMTPEGLAWVPANLPWAPPFQMVASGAPGAMQYAGAGGGAATPVASTGTQQMNPTSGVHGVPQSASDRRDGVEPAMAENGAAIPQSPVTVAAPPSTYMPPGGLPGMMLQPNVMSGAIQGVPMQSLAPNMAFTNLTWPGMVAGSVAGLVMPQVMAGGMVPMQGPAVLPGWQLCMAPGAPAYGTGAAAAATGAVPSAAPPGEGAGGPSGKGNAQAKAKKANSAEVSAVVLTTIEP